MSARQLSTNTMEALMRVAACCSVIRHEAEDLVQDILLAAIEKGRDCGDSSFLPWAAGAIRNRARFVARTAVRRKRRERSYSVEHERSAQSLRRFPDTFVVTLPRSRRVVALLINLGMGRREIAYLLGRSDMAIRQRITGLRKAFAAFAGESESDSHPPFPADGLARRALKTALPKRGERRLAVRDPDGTPIFLRASDHISGVGGNSKGEPSKEHQRMQIPFDRVSIVFTVADIDRTARFYRDHLGFEFERIESDQEGTFLRTMIGTETELLVFAGDPKPGNTPAVVFSLPDGGLDTLIERLATAGIEIVTPVSEAPGGWFCSLSRSRWPSHLVLPGRREAAQARLNEDPAMSTTEVDDVPTVPYFLVLLHPGSNRAAEPQHRAAHIAFIETMEAATVVLLGGEFGSPIDGAQAAHLLHVSSQSEAERWAAQDPLVAEKVFQARVVPWHLVGIASSAIDPKFGV